MISLLASLDGGDDNGSIAHGASALLQFVVGT